MRTLSGNPRQLLKRLLIIVAIPGSLLLVNFLQTPSETGNQFLFGFSRTRLLVAVVFSFLLILNLGGILWTSLRPAQWQIRFENGLNAWVSQHAIAIFVALCLITLLAGICLLIIIPPVIRMFAPIQRVTSQAGGFLLWVFLAGVLFAMYFRLTFREYFQDAHMIPGFERFLLLASLFLIVFFAYEHILLWTGAANQTRYSYWNYLADAFLQGKLYLENPPQTHDLTFHNGKWYQPMPPAPAILMMPLAYLVGGENINTSDFSILLSAINAVLVFLILEQLVRYKWLRLSQAGIFLLVILFAFGTPHLWVGIRGRAWFVSQIVTVTFLALAVLASLKSWSPWLVGAFIGLAIAARPNSIMTWPFAFALAMQILKEKHDSVTFQQMLRWAIPSVLPMGIAVAGLLFYNYARFENFFDFGYVTISGDPTIVANAQTYGIFSPHYIFTNLKAMFLYFPTIQPGSQWPILPSTTGMSIFLITPPLLYLVHRYERHWWILGAWASVFLNFLLLVLYHNTGAHQFGYRYILDAIIPLLALLAVAMDGKIRWHFILLVLFSIAFNLYGTYWFING
ncbi:MAG TPA: hypothetical protein VFR47_11510 [Anaerolineales bacterium]|nr:hypothetical protein [Anaerolineales bacterium]